jgi:hypothetical protein
LAIAPFFSWVVHSTLKSPNAAYASDKPHSKIGHNQTQFKQAVAHEFCLQWHVPLIIHPTTVNLQLFAQFNNKFVFFFNFAEIIFVLVDVFLHNTALPDRGQNIAHAI